MLSADRAMLEARAALRAGDWKRAENLCRSLLRVSPVHFDALNLLAIIAAQTQRPAEAAELLQRALQVRPDDAAAHNNYGSVLRGLGRCTEALESYERALVLVPDDPETHFNRALALEALQRTEAALAGHARALDLEPRLTAAHYARGNLLHRLGRCAEALANFDRTLALEPRHARALNERGIVLCALARTHEALESFDRALAIEPRFAAAHLNRGVALHTLHQYDEALASYARALEVETGFAEAHVNRGNTLQEQKRLGEALQSYERALALDPGLLPALAGRALAGRANVLKCLGRLEEALASGERAHVLAPDQEWLAGTCQHLRMLLCDWRGHEERCAELAARIARKENAVEPFPLLGLIDSVPLQRQAAVGWLNAHGLDAPPPPVIERGVPADKIRVGYFSADYYNHATALLMAGLFERHDRGRFEWFAFSYGPHRADEMRARLLRAFDRFIDVRSRSDIEVATLARELGIDVAVDLKGFTEDQRLGIFAHRAAPVQVSYLGFPGSSGAPFMDYLVADPTVIPRALCDFYSEKIIFLPNSYYPTSYEAQQSRPPTSAGPAQRALEGLPADAFVFCCFNNSFKITPATFHRWMRILVQVPDSVLWLFQTNATAAANLRREAASRGVSGERLVFAQRRPWPAHLARHCCADLFLDTLPYNAHTTASDALWAGLPVLTCMGQSFASRVGGSLLQAIGLPELITATLDDYEGRAIELAKSPARLADLKHRLAQHRAERPLFDTALLARHLEDAYRQIHGRHRRGEPADHIHVR